MQSAHEHSFLEAFNRRLGLVLLVVAAGLSALACIFLGVTSLTGIMVMVVISVAVVASAALVVMSIIAIVDARPLERVANRTIQAGRGALGSSTGQEGLLGRRVTTVDQFVSETGKTAQGKVQLGGELWTASMQATAERMPVAGDTLTVVDVRGLHLVVENSASPWDEPPSGFPRLSRVIPSPGVRLAVYAIVGIGLVLSIMSAWLAETGPFNTLPVWGRGESPGVWWVTALLVLTGGFFWVVVEAYQHASLDRVRNWVLGTSAVSGSILVAGGWAAFTWAVLGIAILVAEGSG